MKESDNSTLIEYYKNIPYTVVPYLGKQPCDECEMKEYCDECIDNELYMLCHQEFPTRLNYICKRVCHTK